MQIWSQQKQTDYSKNITDYIICSSSNNFCVAMFVASKIKNISRLKFINILC